MNIHRSLIRRFFQIAFLLSKHFGGYLLSVILGYLHLQARFSRRQSILGNISMAARIRLFLQEVNGALIKIGQIMAMRPDFLPNEYIEELLKLLDEVPPFDPKLSKAIIEEELNAKISDLFLSFEEEPIAAASFGQVHAATLHNDDEVVVKVQRPGISDTIAADLKLFRLATFFIDVSGLTKRMRLKSVYEDFAEWTREELDYRIEGSHVRQIYNKAKGSTTERIPKVYWALTSRRVLTLERLRGMWLKEIMEGLQTDRESVVKELAGQNTTLRQVSQNILQNSLRQIFEYGIYHADPHAANLLIMKNGVIGYVDFGIIGRISEKSKVVQVKVHMGLESGNFEEFYAAVLEMLLPPYYADLASFEKSVRNSYTTWLNAQYMGGINMHAKSFARLMVGITVAAQQSGVAFSNMEVRVYRTLTIVDAALLQLAPTLDVRSEFRSFFGPYQIRRLIHYDIPSLIRKIPIALTTLSEHLGREITTISVHVSRVRRFFARSFQILSFLLIAGGLIALIMSQTTMTWLTRLQVKPLHAGIGILLAIVFFGWLSRLLHLRSIVRDHIVKPRGD